MPLYEFACRECGHRFEELVGSHVGADVAEVRCPECGAERPQRLISSYAPVHHLMTPNQRRRAEAKRGIDRGGAKERWRRQRAAQRRGRSGGGRG